MAIGTVINDITQRKQAEKTNALLAAFVEHAPEAIEVTDTDFNIEFVNPALGAITGYRKFDAIGKTPEALHRPKEHDPKLYAEIETTLSRGRVWKGEMVARKKDGENWFTETTIAPVRDARDEITHYIAIKRDITRSKRAADALIKAKEEAETANRAKSDFLSSMSHELRTPMNAILGFGQMLELSPKEPLTETQKDYVGYILKGGQHLLELINDVLDLTKIEAGKVDLSIENVCPRDVLDECLALVHSMADERGIGIVVGEGFKAAAEIRAEQTRFKQSLLNLMSNAIKHNRERGKVTVDCHETPGGMLHVSVTDEGEGISEDMRRDLFEPFHRLGLETTKIEGTGIGLTITKQIIERMGGHIGVDTEIGKGSTFWIELPLAEGKPIDEAVADRETVADKAEPLPDVTGTVLYVEDNPASLDLMEVIVARIERLSMISAHNAELAIELAKSKTPDLIILDIDLPGMDGLEVLGKLQRLEETKDIPVIALSANATPKDIEKGVEAGFKRYLTKPIKVEEVVKSIKEGLEN